MSRKGRSTLPKRKFDAVDRDIAPFSCLNCYYDFKDCRCSVEKRIWGKKDPYKYCQICYKRLVDCDCFANKYQTRNKSKIKFFGEHYDGIDIKVKPFCDYEKESGRGVGFTDGKNGRGDKRGHHGYNSGYGPGYGCMCCPDYLDVHVRTSMGRCPIHGTRVPYHRPRPHCPRYYDYYDDYEYQCREMQFSPHVHFRSPIASRYQ